MVSVTPQQLSPAEYAAKLINQTNRNIFLTGKAGTGKTTFLKNILQLTYKRTIVVAPTGIAAINAGGVTIHSQFQLPFGAFIPSRQFLVTDYPHLKLNTPNTLLPHMQMNAAKRRLLQELELLVIDEVSMLRADLLDAISLVLKTVRRSSAPFGGAQILFIGDLLQLPPVVKDEEWRILQRFYSNILFFEAEALRYDKPIYIELDKIYRQSDQLFIDLLNNFRNNQVRKEDIDLLNKYYKPDIDLDELKNTILLTTHNSKADSRNKAALASLNGKPFIYHAKVEGEFNEFAYPADLRLELKAGAQIMFIKNDPTGQQRFFNGRIATVFSLSNSEIMVQFDDTKETIELEKYDWKNIRYELNSESGEIEEKIIGSFTQYPIKLAWAITIHKSQGLTFEKAILDINSAFAPGQIYVALSRLKSLEGLTLTAPAKKFLILKDEGISGFEQTKPKQEQLDEILSNETDEYLRTLLIKSFDFEALSYFLATHLQSYSKPDTPAKKQKHVEWAKELTENFELPKTTAEKFTKEILRILRNKEVDYISHLNNRLESAITYFTPLLKNLIERLIKHKITVRKDKKIKTYLTELEEIESHIQNAFREIIKAKIFTQSIVDKKDFNKQTLREALNKVDLKEGIVIEPESRMPEEEYENKKAKNKNEGPNSKTISLQLFNQGCGINEIAELRTMAPSTIEGHLAHFISTGEIDIKSLMPLEKAEEIIKMAEEMQSPQLKELKEKFGNDVTYTDLKFANALKKFKMLQQN